MMKKKLPLVKKLALIFTVAGVAAAGYFVQADLRSNKLVAQLSKSTAPDDDEPLSTSCGGVERWAVKVLTDASYKNVDTIPKMSSIAHIVNLSTPTPSSTMARYDPVEDSVYTVVCTVMEMRVEADSDWHLVISDGTNTMIAECPSPSCNSVLASTFINDFIGARKWIAKNIGTKTNTSLNIKNVEVTGQAFLDPPHGQSGAAPNNVELHSILRIQFYAPTNVNDLAATTTVRVYPNPSNGQFNVNMENFSGKARIEVFNMFGQLVHEAGLNPDNNQIEMPTGTAKGIYLYKVVSEEGQYIYSGKLIIE